MASVIGGAQNAAENRSPNSEFGGIAISTLPSLSRAHWTGCRVPTAAALLPTLGEEASVRIVGHEQPERRFWRGEEFHSDDLVDYLEGKSVIQAQVGALIPSVRTFSLRGRMLTFEEFAMDVEDAVRIANEQFRIVPADGTAETAIQAA